MSYPVERGGYVYSKGTAAGFSRMQRLGIPRPLFALESKLAKLVEKELAKIVHDITAKLRELAGGAELTADAETDAEVLIRYISEFDEAAKDEELKFKLGSIVSQLEDSSDDGYISEALETEIDRLLKKDQSDYLKRLLSDADDRTSAVIKSFSIDKKKAFDKSIGGIRRMYLDNALERIKGEKSLIKKRILQKITDYAIGNSDTLDLTELVKESYLSGKNLAKMFARDQMQRLNKASTLATFAAAGVSKIKWVTAGDIRVRKSHRALNGKTFGINEIPKEANDYNCRCGLVPVEWE